MLVQEKKNSEKKKKEIVKGKKISFPFFSLWRHSTYSRSRVKEKKTRIFPIVGVSVCLFLGNHSLKPTTMSLESYYSTKLLYEHSTMQLDKNKTKF